MDENLRKAGQKTLEAAALELKKNNFSVSIHADSAAAAAYLVNMTGTGKKAGFGGSATLAELGLADKLKAAGNEVITHTQGMAREEKLSTWFKAQAADFYFASPQAVTMKGELVLLDGNGNRVAACIYGPGKVVLVAGINKIVENLDQAHWRMRNISALANNIRLNRDTPCVKAGKCVNCASPHRSCNILVTFYKKPSFTEVEVVLVNEELGY